VSVCVFVVTDVCICVCVLFFVIVLNALSMIDY